MGSNPRTVYWMEIFSQMFVVEMLFLIEKMKINEKEAGDGPFLKLSLKNNEYTDRAISVDKTLV